jgi:uncharacterized membrane protein YkoI
MSETTSTPEPSSIPDPAPRHSAAVPGGPAAAPVSPKRSRARTALIAGGAVLAGLVLAGGGIAVGAAVADDFADDDQDDTVQTVEDEEDDSDASTDASASYGAESAADVLAVIDAVTGTAEGNVVGVNADQDGTWEVELRRESGDETEVHVDSNGQASVVSAEAAENGEGVPDGVLDRDTVEALVGAALDQADGRIIDIEVDEDQVAPYEVSVLTDDLRTVTLSLDADFAVVSTDDED